jgi:DNA-binding protein
LAILFKLDQGSANIIVAARSTELLRTVEIVRARDLR